MSRQQAKDPRITVDVIYDDMAKIAAVPVGAIVAYGGNTAPAGWHLCDGTAHGSAALQSVLGSANTPDLRDKFIAGVGSAYTVGTTGGAASVTLTAAQSGVPAHNHPVTDPGHSHNYSVGNTGSLLGAAGSFTAVSNVGVSSSTTGVTVGNSTAAAASQSHENRPPFYALTYIIRKA